MTPQLQYGFIGLIILNVCVLIYVLSRNPTQPVKQTAAPPPVAVTPPTQQPPPQQAPRPSPPPPNPYEIEKGKCDSMAATFKDKFLNYWPQHLTMMRGNPQSPSQGQNEYFTYLLIVE
jgi:hypothetical protein